MAEVLRYAAFTADPAGGNPAGVVLDASGLDAAAMQRIAAEVGFPETAFVVDGSDPAAPALRYFSPTAEVPFCGHATVATAVALAAGERRSFRFTTPVGPVPVDVRPTGDGPAEASFTSIEPVVEQLPADVLDELLGLLWLWDDLEESARPLRTGDLASDHPPMTANAGNPHPVVTIAERAVFDHLSFDPAAVRALMDARGWSGTVTLLHRVDLAIWEARNPFPTGDITEDPATGSAAAATGAYLRATGLVSAPARIVIHQGAHVGRPSVLAVEIPATGGITVTGTAVPLP